VPAVQVVVVLSIKSWEQWSCSVSVLIIDNNIDTMSETLKILKEETYQLISLATPSMITNFLEARYLLLLLLLYII